ncbi:MAG: hypothetical protein WC527_08060 [Candidatus Margulisiibacteriota bacterium]
MALTLPKTRFMGLCLKNSKPRKRWVKPEKATIADEAKNKTTALRIRRRLENVSVTTRKTNIFSIHFENNARKLFSRYGPEFNNERAMKKVNNKRLAQANRFNLNRLRSGTRTFLIRKATIAKAENTSIAALETGKATISP